MPLLAQQRGGTGAACRCLQIDTQERRNVQFLEQVFAALSVSVKTEAAGI